MATPQPREIGAADAKQTLLKVLDELPPEGVIITKRGKQVARLLPIPRSTQDLFGIFKGRMKIHGDSVDTSDLLPASAWTGDAHNLRPQTKATKRRKRRA
ncbi:MAG TPA: hypothetical protein VFX59_02570 [Polyangiales bacterium]|nr:hypothetical protein [Polyangiales bacterium]